MYANKQARAGKTAKGPGTPAPADSAAASCALPSAASPEALEAVAAHFRALAEPVRLRLLDLLRDGERPVGELARAVGSTPANVSRHLAVLKRQGLVEGTRHGTVVSYRLVDESVAALCEIVCDGVARRLAREDREARALRDALTSRPA
jgi:DNA-binding transcriptional ArsR family regulator